VAYEVLGATERIHHALEHVAPLGIDVRPHRMSTHAGRLRVRHIQVWHGEQRVVPTILQGPSDSYIWIQVAERPE
jgi:hypothetical protein